MIPATSASCVYSSIASIPLSYHSMGGVIGTEQGIDGSLEVEMKQEQQEQVVEELKNRAEKMKN